MSNFLIHDLVQGSPEWLAYRMDHQNASDAAAMLNISKTTTRSELLRLYYTGDSKEFSDWVQRNILDYGHEVEDKVRPIVDEIIGQPLYPATISLGKLSASSDGMTMDDTIGFECKQYNAKLFAAIQDGELPDEYIPQIQQFFMINNKAVKVIFVCSDGTKENFASMEVLPDKEWFDTIARGWKQFETDLLNYQHVEAKPEAVGKVPESLPALRIEVTGMVTSSNLVVFKETAMAVISAVNTDLKTDQDFADAEKGVKWCKDVEDRLEAAKSHALSQTASIDELFRAIDAIKEMARVKRLDLTNLVKTRKDSRRAEIMKSGTDALASHIANLNIRLGKSYMPAIASDFPGVMRSKKTITSLQDAVDGELARCLILSNKIADKIEINLKSLRDLAEDYKFLFSDVLQIIHKENEDLVSLITVRISTHKEMLAEEARKAAQKIVDDVAKKAADLAAAEAVKKEAAPVITDPPVTIVQQPEQTSRGRVVTAIKIASPALDALALPNHGQEFDDWLKDQKRGFDKTTMSLLHDAFITGYNTGYRNAHDDMTA